ncbi:MAG: S41 family peptidase [Thermoanaerobaculia bacterium]
MRRSWKIAAIALFALSLVLGGFFGDRLLALDKEAREQLHLFTELLAVAQEAYGGEVTYRDLVVSSIDGMVRTLDPHTTFLTADAYSGMRDRQQSSFYGLGILVGMRNGQLTVITPIDGTPAWRLGIRAGDVITAIEGEPTEMMNINEAVRRLKGPKDTEVQITIARPGLDEEPFDLTVVRDEIPQNTVRYAYMLTPTVGYMAISDFNRGTGVEVEETLAELEAQGMESLLLDLRGNGGGLLDQAIAVVELFVPKGSKIVETRGRTRESFQEYDARDGNRLSELPLVVLVGENTSSAAEILAGAIQDHDIGLIVGNPTWGKGLVQTVYSLSYGAGLALTTAKYYTPSGRLIQRDYSSWFDYATHSNGTQVAEEGEELGENDGVVAVEAYLTDLGREVYGGGGITPDVKVEPDEVSTFAQFLLSRNALFDFAVEWANNHPIEEATWEPPAELLDRFSAWLAENELATEDEIAEGLEDTETQEFVRRRIHAEIFNSAFGLESRHQVLAKGDPQIQEALSLFGQATELLAKRQRLEDEEERAETDERQDAVGVGN